MKSSHKFTLEGWMITECMLDGSELILYAILYNFTRKEAATWSMPQLSGYTNIPYTSARRIIKSLREKGLLFVEKKPNDFFTFRAVRQKAIVVNSNILNNNLLPIYHTDQNALQNGDQNGDTNQNGHQIGDQSDEKEKKQKKKSSIKDRAITSPKGGLNRELRDKSRVCSKESLEHERTHTNFDWEEIRAYAERRGIPEETAMKFYLYYSSNGWMIGQNPVKNWRAALNIWVRYPKKRAEGSASVEDYKARKEYLEQKTREEEARAAADREAAQSPEAKEASEQFFKRFNNGNK